MTKKVKYKINMRKVFVILLLPVIWACNSKKNDSIVDSFKTIQSLTHKVFEVQNGSELMDPYNLVVVGNTVNLLNGRAPKYFTTIDITTGRVIKQWGDRGQGPNEFLRIMDIYSNYLETGLNIWDNATSKLYFCSDSNLESDYVYFQNIPINIEEGMLRYNSVIQIDTFIFFAVGGNNDKLFTLFDTKRNGVKEIGDFPPEDKNEIKDLPPIFRKTAYNGRIRYNGSLKKLVYVSITSEMFEIYNFDGADVKLAMGNYSTVPKYEEIARGDTKGVRTSTINGKGNNRAVTVSDENIFILYQDYKRLGMESEDDHKEYADMVLVFDWNGKPIEIYELDCLVQSIAYDKTTNRLWAVNYNPDNDWDPEIIYFELQ